MLSEEPKEHEEEFFEDKHDEGDFKSGMYKNKLNPKESDLAYARQWFEALHPHWGF